MQRTSNPQASSFNGLLKAASFSIFLEQPKELRPCLTGVATRPPAAILSRTVYLEDPGTRSTLRDKTCLPAVGVPYIQTKSMSEAGLRLANTGEDAVRHPSKPHPLAIPHPPALMQQLVCMHESIKDRLAVPLPPTTPKHSIPSRGGQACASRQCYSICPAVSASSNISPV